MRKIAGTLTGLVLGSTLLLAQQTAPIVVQPQQQEPADPELEAALASWEKAMAAINTFHIDCSRVNVDQAWNTTEVYEGVARFQKPDKALLYLAHKTKPGVFEKIVVNSQTLYQWEPSTKVVRIHQLPPPKNGQMADDNFLSFVSGMKAVEAKQRYTLKMLPPPPNDTYYHYIEILPKADMDKADFTKARLVLTIATGLPRQLWFQHPNKSQVTWDFGKVLTNVQLPAQDFLKPAALEKGWTFQAAPAQPVDGPRVVRPQGN